MNRLITVLAVVLILVVAGLFMVPPLYRGMLFKRDCQALVRDAAAGDIARLVSAIKPAQQTAAARLFNQALPPDYESYIANLKLTGWQRNEPGGIQAILTLRTEYNGTAGVYQGRLQWIWDPAARRWWWDIDRTEAAEFSLSGEPDWQPLAQLIQLARNY